MILKSGANIRKVLAKDFSPWSQMLQQTVHRKTLPPKSEP